MPPRAMWQITTVITYWSIHQQLFFFLSHLEIKCHLFLFRLYHMGSISSCLVFVSYTLAPSRWAAGPDSCGSRKPMSRQSSCAILHLLQLVEWQGPRLRSYIAGLVAAPVGPACCSSCAYINTNWDASDNVHLPWIMYHGTSYRRVDEILSRNGYLKIGF